MLSIELARSIEDFREVVHLDAEFGEWDAALSAPYGISREDVLREFHGDTVESLTETFCTPEARLYLARWEGAPAGTVGFLPFDAAANELVKFYVSPTFRGRGIGRTLLRLAMDRLAESPRRIVLLHTTPFMTDAVALYRSLGFAQCDRFRETPENIWPTDYFMSLALAKI